MSEVIIVTGASSGIGASTARMLGALGADVVVNYNRSGDLADKVVDEVRALGGKAIAVAANIGCEADIIRLFAGSGIRAADRARQQCRHQFAEPSCCGRI